MLEKLPEQPTDLWYGTSGPADAEIVLVGEAWGASEDIQKRPFVGASGNELTRILAESGLDRSKILLTNTTAARPPSNEYHHFFCDTPSKTRGVDRAPGVRGLYPSEFVCREVARLHDQIRRFPRKAILAVGNYALWALTNHTGYTTGAETLGRRTPSGIMNWRGSMTYANQVEGAASTPLIPIIHPAAILRQWDLRAITVHDLRARVPLALRGDWRPNPPPTYWAPPTFDQARLRFLHWIRIADSGSSVRLVVDIETAKRLITCIGFADSTHFGMSVPFVRDGEMNSYWEPHEEIILLDLMRRVLSHPNILIIGQNFIYDTQYIEYYLAIKPKIFFDTMLAHHMLWPGTPKGLDYISSLYCHYHWYWKEDGKEWDTKGSLADLLFYNCEDLIRTFEAAEVLEKLIIQFGMQQQWLDTVKRHELALRMMRRGVKIDLKRRQRLGLELLAASQRLEAELDQIIPDAIVPKGKSGKSHWWNSPKQQQWVFSDFLGIKLPRHRKTGNITLGKEVLQDLPRKYPEFTGLFNRLRDLRSVEVFYSHFISADLESNGRMVCEFKPTGTETFRWSSSQNAFRRGTNLQNIPAGDED